MGWEEDGTSRATIQLAVDAAERALQRAVSSVDSATESAERTWAALTEFCTWIGSVYFSLKELDGNPDEPLLAAFVFLRNRQAHELSWSTFDFQMLNTRRPFDQFCWPFFKHFDLVEVRKNQQSNQRAYESLLAGRSVLNTSREIIGTLRDHLENLQKSEVEAFWAGVAECTNAQYVNDGDGPGSDVWLDGYRDWLHDRYQNP